MSAAVFILPLVCAPLYKILGIPGSGLDNFCLVFVFFCLFGFLEFFVWFLFLFFFICFWFCFKFCFGFLGFFSPQSQILRELWFFALNLWFNSFYFHCSVAHALGKILPVSEYFCCLKRHCGFLLLFCMHKYNSKVLWQVLKLLRDFRKK